MTRGERIGVRRSRECAAMGHTGPSCERCGRVVGDPRKTVHRWLERAGGLYDQAGDATRTEWDRLMREGNRWADWAGVLSLLLWAHESREVFA